MGRKKLVLLALAVSGFSYWFYCPLPDGVMGPDRWKVQIFINILRLTGLIPKILCRLSLKSAFIKIARFNERLMPHGAPTSSDVEFQDTIMAGVPVRVYIPNNRKGKGAVIFMHGGGWIFCSVESHHAVVYEMASRSQKVFISVEYRRAPEHIFPSAVEDCDHVIRYILDEGYKEWDVDPDEVAIAGDSAGGNLAAVVAQRLNDRPADHRLKAQILIYPVLQMSNMFLPSYLQANIYGDSTFLTPRAIATFWMLYLGLPLRYSAVMAANEHLREHTRSRPEYQYANEIGLQQDLINKPINITQLQRDRLKSHFPVSDIAKVQDALQPYLFDTDLNPLHKRNLRGLPPTYLLLCGFDPLRDEGFLYAKRLEDGNVSVTLEYYEYALHGVLSLYKMEYGKTVLSNLTDFIRKTIY